MKIEFFSAVDGVADCYPVIEARRQLPSWVSVAQQQHRSSSQHTATVARCPGIIDILTTGYIVTAPWDMEIHSSPEHLVTYVDPVMEELLQKPPIQNQSGDSIAQHIPKRPWSHRDILKINTPWHVKSQYKFLMIPVPYSESFGFEACTGILDPSISSEINVQGYVNGFGVAEIKAGTPLCQLVPVTQDQYQFVVRNANANDRVWLSKRKYINNASFSLNKGLIRQLYYRFLKGT